MAITLLHSGLHPDASEALKKVGVAPNRIVQTIGNAKASAGTHAADGKVNGIPYCCAVDFSIKHPTALNENDVKTFLAKIASVGFAGFYRNPGKDHWPTKEVVHIHAVYAGATMKHTLYRQVQDWLANPMKNGLASHAEYTFWHPTTEQKAVVAKLLAKHPKISTNTNNNDSDEDYDCNFTES